MATTDTKSGKKRRRQVTLDKVGVKCPKLDPAIAERKRKAKKNKRLCAVYRKKIKEEIELLVWEDPEDEYKYHYLKYMSTIIEQGDKIYIPELHDSSDEDKSEDEDSDKEESNVKEDDKEKEDADE